MAKKNSSVLLRLETLLEGEPLNPHQIIDAYKQRWPSTTPSMSQLSNLLSRHKQFVDVGMTNITNTTTSGNNEYIANSYKIKVWTLNEHMV